jgi:GT2 family glycosyltransferase
MSQPKLEWALVLATYKRSEILKECIRCALLQTRAPSEIVIIDASPDWRTTRNECFDQFRAKNPSVSWTYVEAVRPSSTMQRNQGVALARADVLFLIDDDSLMYPDCAEEVMKVYERDSFNRVLGVFPLNVDTPPENEKEVNYGSLQNNVIKQTWLRKLIKRMINSQSAEFLPYDQSDIRFEVPPEILELDVSSIRYTAGYRMTFRRSILLKEQFSEILERYAAGEDQDLSYRVSRHGLLLNCHKARLCHLEVRSGRLSPYTVAILAALNPAALHQIHSSNLGWSHREWVRKLRKRLIVSALKEISQRNWRFPRTRGTAYALRNIKLVQSKTATEIQNWYPVFQSEILARDPSR